MFFDNLEFSIRITNPLVFKIKKGLVEDIELYVFSDNLEVFCAVAHLRGK